MASIKIKITKLLAQHVVVITSSELKSYCLQPYRTYVLSKDGTELESADFVTAAAALLHHDALVRRAIPEDRAGSK